MTEAAYVRDIPALLAPLIGAGPITAAVMVASVDGRATVDGRVGDLTGQADQQVLLGAREHAAAVVVGRRTVSAEGYDGLLDDEARARRVTRGLEPEPELVVFGRNSPSPPELWHQLRERHPDQLIVCEGGPTTLGLIVEHQLLDQLVIGISPQLVGDDTEKRLVNHLAPLDQELELLAATIAEGFLFLRYGLR